MAIDKTKIPKFRGGRGGPEKTAVEPVSAPPAFPMPMPAPPAPEAPGAAVPAPPTDKLQLASLPRATAESSGALTPLMDANWARKGLWPPKPRT